MSPETTTMTCTCKYSIGIAISCLIGILLSVYALNVEIHAEIDKSYEAMCDISEKISCSKVFTSKYGRGFGIVGEIFGQDSILNQPNSLGGIFFYVVVGVLAFVNTLKASKIQIGLVIISNLISIYLAYLLYFVLEDFCVVCVSTYVVNFTNLMLAIKRYNLMKLAVMEEMETAVEAPKKDQ